MRWKRWEIALAVSLLAAVMMCSVPIRAQEQLADKLVRLHVLANSDSAEDQRLKLTVRDAVLQAAEGAGEIDDTLLYKLQQTAWETVEQEGYTYPVTVTREHCWFDTRRYETFSLPAGYYDAVRVVIGEGEGENWWCVIYPPLCAGICEEELVSIAAEFSLSDEEISLICEEEGYIIRFKLADLWGKFVGRMRQI
ncbi:MAG: stage II sporulation protein R [Clostridia bacterium]|nr:stage II sporulation protein R [Clostridia bacterium]